VIIGSLPCYRKDGDFGDRQFGSLWARYVGEKNIISEKEEKEKERPKKKDAKGGRRTP